MKKYDIEGKNTDMQWKKNLTRAAAGLAAGLLALTLPVSAMRLIGADNLYSRLGVDTRIAAGTALSARDAAMRLYYLGLLSGSGTDLNGGVEFHLERGLNRLEAAVFAVRLMGAEETAREAEYAHPYTDVPEWASVYVGYLYAEGLLSDRGGEHFQPSHAETAEHFSSYLLHALGYRMADGDYTVPMAAAYARDAGLCVTEKDEPLTRGDAVLSMYNTLRATCRGSDRVYSDCLVERGALEYQDAVFFLWNRDAAETEAYMQAVGYGSQWIVPNGYYTIHASEGSQLLNVAMNGANQDYNGVPVTLWEDTDDITQTFRLERTERGTYYIYAASSRSGYGRVIGTDAYSGAVGLYPATSAQAMEFYLEGGADGSWSMVSAEDHRILAADDFSQTGSPVVLDAPGTHRVQTWKFDRAGILNEDGEEMAIFVAQSLRVTQGAYDDYSHMNQNAIDITPVEGAAYAPFNGKIVRIDASEARCNGVWVQSNEKVHYADGSYDYMTVLYMHDNDISDLSVGQGLAQGEPFYHSGNAGAASGIHIHIAVYRGAYHSGMTFGSGDVYAEDALFLPDDTYIYDDYGLDWTVLSLAD